MTSYPAVALRAYAESYDLADVTQDERALYPGFDRATQANAPSTGNYLTELVRIRPLPSPVSRAKRQAFGQSNYYLLELTPVGESLNAILCRGTYAVYSPSKSDPSKFVSGAAFPEKAEVPSVPNPGIDVIRVVMTKKPTTSPAALTAPQKGPEVRPEQDVFGPWFVTARSAGYWGPIDDPRSRDFPSPELVQRCADAMPQNAEERLKMISGFKSEPPAVVQAIPGWPKPAN